MTTGTTDRSTLPYFQEQAKSMYQTYLGREGDEEGINYWAGELAKGGSANAFADNFKESARVTLNDYLTTGDSDYAEYLNKDLNDPATAGSYTSSDRRTNARSGLTGNVFEKLYGDDTVTGSGGGTGTGGAGGGGTPRMRVNRRDFDGPTPWNVTGDQTVQGQLARVLAQDSPLMQQARTRAAQRSNATGTLNTSMASTAAESAMIDAATPIAERDAATFAESGRFNADSSNVFTRDMNQRVWDAETANFNVRASEWDSGSQKATLDRGYINALTEAKNQYAEKLAAISSNTQMDSALKKETLENLRNTYNTIIGNYSRMLGWDPKSWLIAAEPMNASGGGSSPTGTAGSQVLGTGRTANEEYQAYRATGGNLMFDQWMDLYGWQLGGGPGNASSSPSANSSSTPGPSGDDGGPR
jgi:ribulose bisphosphate carboxylase small subunit